jgi:hypothetical protein
MEARLKSHIQVQALIRRCDLAAIAVVVGTPVLTQTRRADATLVWLRATGADPVAEADADAYIARQRQYDPDLWVVEIETAAPETVLDDGIIE